MTEAKHRRRVVAFMVGTIMSLLAGIVAYWTTKYEVLSVLVLGFMIANNSIIIAILDDGKD